MTTKNPEKQTETTLASKGRSRAREQVTDAEFRELEELVAETFKAESWSPGDSRSP